MLNARNAREIDTAFKQLLGAKADGIITATDPIPLDRREQIVAFAKQHKLPVVGFVRQLAAVGGLLSYGPSISFLPAIVSTPYARLSKLHVYFQSAPNEPEIAVG